MTTDGKWVQLGIWKQNVLARLNKLESEFKSFQVQLVQLGKSLTDQHELSAYELEMDEWVGLVVDRACGLRAYEDVIKISLDRSFGFAQTSEEQDHLLAARSYVEELMRLCFFDKPEPEWDVDDDVSD